MSAKTTRFTVISWATASYKHLADELEGDCREFGYPFHLYEINDNFSSPVKAWCNHPRIIRQGVNDFGAVLFLDAECRIVAPIPVRWRPPLVSVRRPPQGFWIRYNTGTVMADGSCLPVIDAWLRVIETWNLSELQDHDYVHWPGDINDELALAAALAVLGVKVQTPELEYVDRNSDAEIVRGLWKNDFTVLQHPTIHHWKHEVDPLECKKLFAQNYPHDPVTAGELFGRCRGVVSKHGWVFDTERAMYAPAKYWPGGARPWTHEEVTLTSAQR